MLDQNNSLLTAVSEEEAATVCGGGTYSLTFDAKGNAILTYRTDINQTGQSTGPAATDVKLVDYAVLYELNLNTGTANGTAFTTDGTAKLPFSSFI